VTPFGLARRSPLMSLIDYDISLTGLSVPLFPKPLLQTLNDAIAAQGIEPSAEIKAKFGGFDSLAGKLHKIVHVDQWRKLAYKAITVACDTEEGKPQALKKAFKRSRDKLFTEKYTVQHGDYVWRFFDENKG